jgi:ech hydrogenase subunit A
LEFNLLGGLAFLIGIMFLYRFYGVVELDKAVYLGKLGALVPVALISFAGLTKSAQMPFSSWLLGAMVAPTPVSALLHSSTMVKAGVYIILRFASALQGSVLGLILALIGGVTFLITSLIAVSQSDAKKVLAYSTIANLGLIVLCAGVGTYEAMWAAMLLIVFHAVTKCLLFLCVGAVEHRIHSRNIEDMSGLIISMPKISIMMQIGMVGMFLAPFGMLISKWAVLKALVDYNPLLAVFVVFGSSATLFFWVKWMGKMITVVNKEYDLEEGMNKSEMIPLYILSFLTIGLCGFFPAISAALIQPYVIEIYGTTIAMSHGNVVIMSIMLAMVMLFPLSFINYGKRVKVVDAYLGGANVETNTSFRGAGNSIKDMAMKNYYMEKYFGEARLYRFGILFCFIFLVSMFMVLVK